jgi:hypothetical protein
VHGASHERAREGVHAASLLDLSIVGRSAGERHSFSGGKIMAIFGDTPGVLDEHEQGGNQNLSGLPFDTTVVGDAGTITDFADGGDDTLRGISDGGVMGENNLFGDALDFMFGHAEGGDDLLLVGDNTSGQPVRNFLYGDARGMDGFAQGGNDILIGENNTDGPAGVLNQLFGDALTLSDKAEGGDDNLTGGNQSGPGGSVVNNLFGDADTMTDSAKGGMTR